MIEQDHRAIKRHRASMTGFKFFTNAAIAIARIEWAHRIRKGQFCLGRGRPLDRSREIDWQRALA